MVFATDPHVERAQQHVASGDAHRLRYACLELRFALERIAYQKLQVRLGEVSIEEIAAWQPKRVMDALMELVDPDLNQDAILSVALEGSDGKPVEAFKPVGTNKGVNPKDIGKYWQKLGFYLHMTMPRKKGEHPKEPYAKKLATFLTEVITYVQKTTSTGFDAHFSVKATFECGACHQTIVRNARLLKEGEIVQCQNTGCVASYKAYKENADRFRFEPHLIDIPCKQCGGTMHIAANQLLKLPYWESATVLCECGTRHLVRWQLYHALEDAARAEAQLPVTS